MWKNIPGYEGLYAISDEGLVKSLERIVVRSDGRNRTIPEKIKSFYLSNKGYPIVQLAHKGTMTAKSVHRLVAELFLEKPNAEMQVNHKNGNKLDNNVQNLEWVTASENLKHSYKILGRKKAHLGLKNPTWSSKKIEAIGPDGNVVCVYDSARDAERIDGYSYKQISKCVLGQREKHAGLRWRYV